MLFNKPRGWSSFDVVRKVRSAIRIKKVGHAGTLDPLATGLLILCTGKHTKTIESIQAQPKEYIAHIKLGATTPCYDGEMPEENHQDASHITQEQIVAAMADFLGEIEQTPPIFSAIKVDGKRAYKAARKGKEVKIRSRMVHIYEYEWMRWAEETAECYVRVRCSKGTYIRSLAHDLGQVLGVGAYLKGLERTKIGDYRVEDAWDIQEFVEQYRVPVPPKMP